ncbi:unnamed protein product [Urochloa decumbens]|uniref:Protein kinase domain-containing protein n=1 Tax=Urochloa decumbens TaxID=240449 RepID=A0ABC9EE54_9POAL
MCASFDNSHNCAIKWSSYKHIIIEEPREAVLLKKLLHKNIRRMFCAWVENREATDLVTKHSVFLAQEFCKRTLEDYLDEKTVKSISERVNIFAETVSGVSYLHSQGIVHRDTKCSNIFIDDYGNVKVGDFGQSGLLSSHSCSHGGKLYGTKLYGSPELLRKQRHGLKSDVFSLGMVYAELFGPSAIATERREWLLKLRRLIQSPQWKKNPFSSWQKSELSKDWCGDVYLMMKMLESTPEERPSCAKILELL